MEPSMSLGLGARMAGGVLLWLCADGAWAAESMRCGSRLVAEGDSAAKLLAVCGEPDLRDSWQAPGFAPGLLAETEQWTYNFGSQKLLRLVRLRQGRIERMDSEGYGFALPATRDCSAAAAIVPGMSKYRLLARCGEPLLRTGTHLLLERPPRHYGGGFAYSRPSGLEAVYREEWTYNLGSSRLMRVVVLDNGRVGEVRTGERGFDRHGR